ncbi:hypothetical protein HMPREF1475_02416 [Hoylesella oralis HGA0225]|nr:hypothetical protein HMPREF1475_02416 [Hoylesella oralis HGA0225]
MFFLSCVNAFIIYCQSLLYGYLRDDGMTASFCQN